jgi:16S rRNA (guanine527-N7)-methyltransferase
MFQLKTSLQHGLTQLKLNMPQKNQNDLLSYMDLLIKWNRSFNLISNSEPKEVLYQHILDSLTIVPYIDGQTILDFGTGAGLPGIPLALALPERQFVLLDSVGKKINFVRTAVAELKLQNVEVVQARVEAFASPHCFDNVVTRAFGTASDIIKKTKHLICPEGKWLLMKGLYPTEELQAINAKYEVYSLQVPDLAKQRHLVRIFKH